MRNEPETFRSVNASARFRSREDARLRPDLSLGDAGDGFVGTIGDSGGLRGAARAMQLLVRRRSKPRRLVRHYFALDHPLAEICASFPDDPAMQSARSILPRTAHHAPAALGMSRHFHHFVDETGGAYPADVARLAERFGNRSSLGRETIWTFPTASTNLRRRAKTSCATARSVIARRILLATARASRQRRSGSRSLAKLPDDELRAQLCALPGVGAKVANCVMLFAYERLRAFPIDVWIERVLREKYFPRRRRLTARKLREFCGAAISASTAVMPSNIFSIMRARQPRAGCHPGEVR